VCHTLGLLGLLTPAGWLLKLKSWGAGYHGGTVYAWA
jgi:hypothetical protein